MKEETSQGGESTTLSLKVSQLEKMIEQEGKYGEICESYCNQSINKLNDDCLALVLSYLPLDERIRLERVSKRWQRLSFKQKLPYKMKYDTRLVIGDYGRANKYYDCSRSIIKYLLVKEESPRGNGIRDYYYCMNMTALKSILSRCPIDCISFGYNVKLSEDAFNMIASHATYLKSLRFYSDAMIN